ncbi:hypothetical protein KBC40_03200 [Patescibacteria group bacterium]|nr:hypothetical protein [Patescibacteria group bacterium]
MLEYNQDQNKNFQTPVPNVVPVTDTRPSVEQVGSVKPKRKWWLYALLVVIFVLLVFGAWWLYANYSSNTEASDKIKQIVDIDSIVDEQAVDNFTFFDTRTIEVNDSNERINEFSFLLPKEMELTRFTGATVYFKKNDTNLALSVMSYKIEGETDRDHLSSYAVVLEDGEYKFEQNKNLLLYREDFTLSKSKIEIGGGEFDDYHVRLLKNGHLTSISYIDFDNTEAGAFDVLDKVIDSLQNYGPVGYSGQDEPSVNVDLQETLESLAVPVVLCLDFQKELSQPVSGALICDAQTNTWPTLSNGYQWSQEYGSDTVQMTWNYCIYHESDLDIFCDQSGCRQENCRESIENGKQNKNEQQVSQVDTDQDGLSDVDELKYGTDLNNPDSDNDTYSDGQEVNNGYNPLGDGFLKVSDFSLATPEDTLAAWAKSIHDVDVKLFLNIATSNNAKYPLTYDEGYDYLTWVRGFYGGKSITFEIISRENKADNILALEVRTLLDGEFFRDDSIELIQLDKKWWVYVPRYEN